MKVSGLSGEVFYGKVGFIYPSVSRETRTMKVRLEFANSSLRLQPGMYAEVDVAKENGSALAVPVEAVMDGGETQYAFVVHDRTHFEPRLLRLGRSSGEWVEVHSGLTESEEVVTSANFLIDSESRLQAAIAGMGGTQSEGHEGHGR
jgi:multidrug efflux pump subunit AcrA (membrane-fusion protein)